MRVDIHTHVFTFKTFLTAAAEINLKARLAKWHLSEAAANDAVKIAKGILFGDAVEACLDALAQRYNLEGNSILEFLRRGCLADSSPVTDRLMADTRDGAGSGQEALAVILMMDVVNGDSTPSELAQYETQFRQAVLQAVRYPGRVLPFVAVNPLRGEGALDYLRRGLKKGRCVGVKLYPSLGFPVTDPMMPRIMETCQRYSAPVIMHCNDGGFCGPGYDCVYCSPMAWEGMLKQYKKVRIDFAHYGDHTPGNAMSDTNPSWREFIGTLMDRYPEQVYADVSFQAGALGSDTDKTNYADWLRGKMLTDRKNNILFGTDSFLVLMATSAPAYWEYFRSALGEADFARIAETNPVKFLGLPVDGRTLDPDSALGRHVAYLQAIKDAGDNRFGEGAPPASWLAPLLR